MGFNKVYKALQDVFPQVDSRILKAAAIEHTKDADAAVEFILLEVLPTICSTPEAPHVPIGNRDDDHPSICSPLGAPHTPSDCWDVGQSSSGQVQIEESQLLEHQEAAVEANASPSESRSFASADVDDSHHTSKASIGSSTCLDEELVGSLILQSHGENISDQLCVNNETEELSSKHQEFLSVGSHEGSHLIHDDIVFFGCNDVPHATFQDLNESAYDTGFSVHSDTNPNEMEIVAATVELDSSHDHKEAEEFLQGASENEITSSSEYKEPESRGSLETDSEQVNNESKMVDLEDDSSSTDIVIIRSGQICRIDLLEDAFSEAKNNKKTLFSSMESVINMMREVEHLETEAEHAKEEAVRGGSEILAKVEDIKQMLLHAKEANDMHAGEVYGEKAILATEARELQSRLLNLSYERDRSLSILDEMRQTLETRLVDAEEVRKAAKQDKLAKEESARKALMEQELIMGKVVQESKRLQQEAEENSKLREFLMDRGHIVDMLQGEIAVICQDVKLLKENFDDQIPISQSLSSSQTSCKLASSGSSAKSQASNLVPEQVESPESPKMISTILVDDSSETSTNVKGVVSARKELSDDDWDLFDDEDELSTNSCH